LISKHCWPKLIAYDARVAQLDRVTASEAAGCGFNSRHAHHFFFRMIADFPSLTEWKPPLVSRANLGEPFVALGAAAGLRKRRGSDKRLTEIKLKKGESVEKALRRLKKRIDREGTLREVRNHRHYEKPSERRRRKMKVARFSAMLSARYADL
jgi:small subunit ribosomal protein S21